MVSPRLGAQLLGPLYFSFRTAHSQIEPEADEVDK